MRIRLLAIVFFVALTVASVQSNNYQISNAPKSVLAKIDPWVLRQTAAKGQAEFLVVLADQADLSAAERLRTKEEKGWYVYRTLYDKAQATQKPILNWLKTNGVEHRSFYIVNMIWVKGNLDVALALAARADVGRIDGNPVIHNNLPEPSLSPDKGKAAAPDAVEAGINYSGAPLVWSMGYTGQGIVVGGADTGIQWDQPRSEAALSRVERLGCQPRLQLARQYSFQRWKPVRQQLAVSVWGPRPRHAHDRDCHR